MNKRKEDDEPIKLVCDKCQEYELILYDSGIYDTDLVTEIIRDMREDDEFSIAG